MLENLQLFFGEANNAEARVYARLPSSGLPDDCRLLGRVVGPVCEYSRTLPAAISFMKQRRLGEGSASAGSASAILIEAIVPDPCFWSPELPFLYRAEFSLTRGERVLATLERGFGIRPLGARGRHLIWEGRTWVARVADRQELPERPLADWRTADLAMLAENPSDDLCEEATRLGVVIIADVTEEDDRLAAEALGRLARWPTVAIALVGPDVEVHPSIRSTARNLLLGERRNSINAGPPRRWADVVVCSATTEADLIRLAKGLELPVLAERAAGWCDDLTEARRRCDALQRDVAGIAELAGYIV